MKITATGYNTNINNYQHTEAQNHTANTTSAPIKQDVTQSNYLHFTGWWFNRKPKPEPNPTPTPKPTANNGEAVPFEGDEHGMSAKDYTVSFKVADIIHRLDDESILVIGDKEGFWCKMAVKSQLTKEDSELTNPKNIRNVYMVHHDTKDPVIIQKKDDETFKVIGFVCNLTNPDRLSLLSWDHFRFHHGYEAKFGDVVETQGNLKIKFFDLPKEANTPMYDAKYPVDSFLSDSMTLNGGVVLNSSDNSNCSCHEGDETGIKYGRPIPERTFNDIAGMDDSIDFMKRKLMYPIMYPEAFEDDKNHGIILYGPPGTGKTLLALATIGEIKKRQNKDVHFIKINSRDLEQKYVGVTEEMWRKVFQELQDNQPSVLFIDEIEALMQDRNGLKDNSSNSETSVVAQLLQSIDELEKTNAQVWIIGATNRINAVDPAIKRSGRLGDTKEVKRPDEKGCREILDLYLKKKRVSKKFDRDNFAKKCHNLEYTGADIAQIVSEARNKMYDRCGITKKMENGTYKKSDLKNLVYCQSDFDEALKTQEIRKDAKRRIGFNV